MRIGDALDLEIGKDDIDSALSCGAYFEKVHSDDISTFVANHEEILERFGDRYVKW